MLSSVEPLVRGITYSIPSVLIFHQFLANDRQPPLEWGRRSSHFRQAHGSPQIITEPHRQTPAENWLFPHTVITLLMFVVAGWAKKDLCLFRAEMWIIASMVSLKTWFGSRRISVLIFRIAHRCRAHRQQRMIGCIFGPAVASAYGKSMMRASSPSFLF